MMFWRVTCAASALALILASPALSSGADAWPAPPDAPELVLLPEDLEPRESRPAGEIRAQAEDVAAPVAAAMSDAPAPAAERDVAALLPEPPAPAEVALDILPEPAATSAPDIAALMPPPAEPAEPDLAFAPLEPAGFADAIDKRSVASLSPAPEGRLMGPETVLADPAPGSEAPPRSETAPRGEAAPGSEAAPAMAAPTAGPGRDPQAPQIAPQIAPQPSPQLGPQLALRLADAVRHVRLPVREQEGVIRFYAARSHEPLWVDGDGLTARGRALAARLDRAGEEGLRAADYATPRPAGDPASLAEADVRLSVAAILYARDARGGRIDPRRLSSLITPRLDLPSAETVLAALAAGDAGEAVHAFNPPHEGYRALRTRLAELRREIGQPAQPEVRVPTGPALRIGMRDPRVPLLRARFGLEAEDGRTYDRSLSTVVAEFQRENGLPSTGVLNRATLDAMNGGRGRALEGDLIATMERWRWLPADLGDEHVIVNVPEYVVRKVEGGAVVHESRAIVGKAERPTPIFSDEMDHLVVNPSWTVPPTILRKDFLPKMASDPDYAARRGLQVIRRGNNIALRQPPGPTNALGNIKFMFPNDHAVYLHDTPNRGLFGSARRALSSGCVRVERPMRLAELILNGEPGNWSEQRLRGLIGSGERTIRLTRKLPVHLVYMTHVVDGSGELRTFDDIYGFHRRTREALGL